MTLKPTHDYAAKYTSTFRLDPEKTALVIVDMQYATGCRSTGLGKMMKEQGKEDQVAYRFSRIEDVVVPNIRRLLDFFRERQLRVLYLTNGSETPDLCDIMPHKRAFIRATNNIAGFREHEILDELKPRSGEVVINKTSTGAFNSSSIDHVLRSMGIQYLVFTGISTNMCVDLTARDAADRGYRCVMVEDCCGSAKEEYHNWALVTFQRFFGRVETVDAVMKELGDALEEESSNV